MKNSTCTNYFKSGENCTTVKDYTNIWIRLINQLEQSKLVMAEAK